MKKIYFLLSFLILTSCITFANVHEYYNVVNNYELKKSGSNINIIESERGYRIYNNIKEKGNFYIVVYSGKKKTGGYSIEIENVLLKNETLEIKLKEVKPLPGKKVIQAFTYPYLIIKLNYEFINIKKIIIVNENNIIFDNLN